MRLLVSKFACKFQYPLLLQLRQPMKQFSDLSINRGHLESSSSCDYTIPTPARMLDLAPRTDNSQVENHSREREAGWRPIRGPDHCRRRCADFPAVRVPTDGLSKPQIVSPSGRLNRVR